MFVGPRASRAPVFQNCRTNVLPIRVAPLRWHLPLVPNAISLWPRTVESRISLFRALVPRGLARPAGWPLQGLAQRRTVASAAPDLPQRGHGWAATIAKCGGARSARRKRARCTRAVTPVCARAGPSESAGRRRRACRRSGGAGLCRKFRVARLQLRHPQPWGGLRRAAGVTASFLAAQAARRCAEGRPAPSDGPVRQMGGGVVKQHRRRFEPAGSTRAASPSIIRPYVSHLL